MDTFRFEFHDEIHTSHPYGIEVTYNIRAQAVPQYDDDSYFTGMDFDILEIEYQGQQLPCYMPQERMFAKWIERVKDKARDVYNARKAELLKDLK